MVNSVGGFYIASREIWALMSWSSSQLGHQGCCWFEHKRTTRWMCTPSKTQWEKNEDFVASLRRPGCEGKQFGRAPRPELLENWALPDLHWGPAGQNWPGANCSWHVMHHSPVVSEWMFFVVRNCRHIPVDLVAFGWTDVGLFMHWCHDHSSLHDHCPKCFFFFLNVFSLLTGHVTAARPEGRIMFKWFLCEVHLWPERLVVMGG